MIYLFIPAGALCVVGAFWVQHWMTRSHEARRAQEDIVRFAMEAPIQYELWLARTKKELAERDIHSLNEQLRGLAQAQTLAAIADFFRRVKRRVILD